jgi:hypothetical protein
MRSIGVLLVIVGCHADGGGTAAPDAPAAPDDALMSKSLGIFVPWHADPPLPGALDEHFTISSAAYAIAAFEVIGDAGPGDERTTHTQYSITWDASGAPVQETFPDAPVGMYSKVTVNMAGASFGEFSYQIQGTWRDSGLTKPFNIVDYARLSTTFDCQQTLAAGGSATIPISIKLGDAMNAVDFRRLAVVDGVVQLAAPDPQLLVFRAALVAAFKVSDSDDGGAPVPPGTPDN